MRQHRKTVSFDDDIYEVILHFRGKYISETLKDKTFTEAVNELLREILKQKGLLRIKEE